MKDQLHRPTPASIADLTQALKPYFGPVLASLGAGVPYDSEDAGNAFWVEAAASVWLELEQRQRKDWPVKRTGRTQCSMCQQSGKPWEFDDSGRCANCAP